jgi:hypothetical protein
MRRSYERRGIGPARTASREGQARRLVAAGGATITAMESKPIDERQETIAAILAASGRRSKAMPVRRLLVQQGPQDQPQPGPLRDMLRGHDERALDLYLLLLAAASSHPWDVTRDALVWSRALGLPTPQDDGTAAVSKVWRRLDETYGLVARARKGRRAQVTVLYEDGSRRPYTYPNGRGDDRYFKLPYAYWTEDKAWYRTLSLPAKATLLISLSLRPPFILPTELAPRWYGISTDSAERGLRELRDIGVLDRRIDRKTNWLVGEGYVTQYRYRLLPPFALQRRTRHLKAVGEVAS